LGKTVSRQIFIPEPPNAAKAANKKRQPLSAGDAGSELPATIPNAELSARRQAMQGPPQATTVLSCRQCRYRMRPSANRRGKTRPPSEELQSQRNKVPNDCEKRIGSRWVAIASTGNPLRSEAERVHEQEFEKRRSGTKEARRQSLATKENLLKQRSEEPAGPRSGVRGQRVRGSRV
jgi:hypothetical protein